MQLDNLGLKVLNIGARILGALWLIGGVAFLLISFLSERDRYANIAVGMLFLIFGVGLLVVKSANLKSVEKIKNFVRRMRRPI